MLVLLSLCVMLNTLLSSLVCAAASFSCACLVSVQVSALYVIAGSTHELSLQADGKISNVAVNSLGEMVSPCLS